MTVDDKSRLQLHRRLEDVLGADEANTLMAHLPPATWQDLATKQDLAALRSDLHAEIAAVRTDLRAEMADVRVEIAAVRTDLRAEVADLRTEITAVQVEMYKGFTRQTWLLVGFVAAFNSVLAAILTVAA